MPFASKRQQRAAFAGVIPGIDREKAKEWADKTDFSELPERAASQKGKPTMRSKEANQVQRAFQGAVDLSKAKGLGRVGQLLTGSRAAKLEQAAATATRRGNEHSRFTKRLGRHVERATEVRAGQPFARKDPVVRAGQEKLRRSIDLNHSFDQHRVNRHLEATKERKAVRRARTAVALGAGGAAAAGLYATRDKEKAAVLEAFQRAPALEALQQAMKVAALGSLATSASKGIGQFKGMMTTNALKAPGPAVSAQAVNPRRNVVQAMNAFKAR